jgi:hypothetical protein
MKPQPRLLPKTYRALMEISLLRDTVSELQREIAEAEAARYLSRLEHLESEAARLLDQIEARHRMVAH